MENYIALFNTISEYEQESGNLPKPNVVYVEENGQLYYNKDYEPLRIWVDDFDCEDNPSLCEEIPDFVDDPEGMGSNRYDSINETINIDGINYCLWEASNEVGQPPYLLTTTYDYNELYSQSLEDDNENDFESYYSMMEDGDELYHEGDETQKLIKIIKL